MLNSGFSEGRVRRHASTNSSRETAVDSPRTRIGTFDSGWVVLLHSHIQAKKTLADPYLTVGIIERHIEYRKSLYECGGPVSNSVDFVLNPSTSSEKRRPGSRSVSLARGRGRRSVSRNSNYGTRIDLESQGDGAEDGVGDEERQPLLVAR